MRIRKHLAALIALCLLSLPALAELGAADEAYRGETARAVKDREDAEKAEK